MATHQKVKDIRFATCDTCGKEIIYSNLTPEAADGFDERWGRCENKHKTIFLISPRMKENKATYERQTV